MSRRMPTVLLVGLISVAGLPTPGADPDERPDWQPYFRDLAGSYRIVPESAPERPLVLHESPVLRWSQPVRGGDDGALFVWLKDGEPAVAGTMFCWPRDDGKRVVVNEFHSLLAEPLVASRGDEAAWSPTEGGIAWAAFPDAPAPAPSASGRLIQMRRLADRFGGENVDDYGGGKKLELRLMPQPLYRFDLSEKPPEAGAALDGALFALASGNDPEILVLIAARTAASGLRWEWALARFSDRPLTARLDDREVFSVGRAHPTRSTPHTYFDVDFLVRPPQPDEKRTDSP